MIGATQEQVAESLGITFQQVQKYETGMNRVSASRLWEIASVLGVPVSFFFEGLETDGSCKNNISDLSADTFSDKEALELLRSLYAIPQKQRRPLINLARILIK